MKNQVNMTASKETNQAPITDPKETETYELSDKEIKLILLKKARKLQEHRQLNKLRKTRDEQNEMFNKEIETIGKKSPNPKS